VVKAHCYPDKNVSLHIYNAIKMYRAAQKQLQNWRKNPDRKPLIISGARQVGKTWLMKEFARTNYHNFAYVNFEDAPQLQSLFVEDFDIDRILKVLEIYTAEDIHPADTLIILDEIQAVERGLTSLKYFQEKTPGLHVVAAGSLLGVSNQKDSFPVGKVDFIEMYPLSFSEFLLASGEEKLIDLLSSRDWKSIALFRAKFINYLKSYYYIGGMPEAVASYMKYKDWSKVREIQDNILRAYELDFSKHAPGNTIPRIRMVWQSISAQLAKENKKFLYGSLKTGGRAKDFELAIQWLIDAGLVIKSCRVTKPELPLAAFEELSVFKLFLVDVGLLSAMCALSPESIIDGNEMFLQFKGALTEQFVHQQLRNLALGKIAYWTNDRSTNEVDFIVQAASKVIPIEVKADTNVKAKSFRFFCDKYKPEIALRVSLKDYSEESWMTNIPLYAVEFSI
jgi:predicted AAA+ superfamily ATPase